MNKSILNRLTMALALATSSVPAAHAEDIDIFSATASSTAAPNVLIVMDNTANWSQSFAGSTKFASEKAALATVVTALTAEMNLGLMLFTETGGGNSGNDGGYVRFAIQAMSTSTGSATDARTCLLKMVGSGSTCNLSNNTYFTNLDINSDKSNGGKAGVTMAEAYEYFSGTTAYAGINKAKADYTRAFTSGQITGSTYKVPPSTNSCVKNYIIVLSNGPFSDNTSDTTSAMSLLSGAGGNTTVINPPDTSNNNNAGDEWTRWLNASTVGAVTYTLEVGPSTTGQGPYNTKLLQSMGTQGKGGYYSANDAASLLLALQRIFNDILATNSVFASASLPLSADNSGAYANQVYMGVFRPDANSRPRWMGNLKQYKFAVDSNSNLSLVDSLGNQAASGSTGFAQPDAVSFWTSKDTTMAPDATAVASTSSTTGSTGGFWYFDSKGSGLSYDSPDGQFVEKGGAAQMLRLAYLGYGGRGGIGDTNSSTLNSKPARKVYTCSGTCANGSSLANYPFEYNNSATSGAITATALGASSDTELQTMLKWIRGKDTANENNFQVNSTDTDVRASIHGDVLHMRPVVLNYGPAKGVFVFYGGNDGVFRAIKGGQSTSDDSSGITPGTEQWAFIPTEFFGTLKRLYSNSPVVLYPSTNLSTTPTPTKRDYFFDGPVGFYTESDSTGAISKAYLFIGMRRGGRLIYALDVSDPQAPKFLWKKSSSDAGFAELGQTWSQPTIAKVKANGTNPVLIFGAGYDATSEDAEPPSSTDSMGRAIYVLDAATGAPLWAGGQATNFSSPPSGMTFKSVPAMNFAIPADVLVLDRDFDGYADRIYVPDVGGNLWRVDISDQSAANWNVWKIASLADRTVTASTRKFLFGVDAVFGSTFDSVFLGSGDREHPLSSAAAQNVTNRFYMIKDTNTGLTGTDLTPFDTCGATTGSCTNLFDATGGATVPSTELGWSLKFATGEKVINRPVVVAGHVLFGTNQPDTSNTSCTASLGIAKRYDIQVNTISANTTVAVSSTTVTGGGFIPSTAVGLVEINGQKYLYTLDNFQVPPSITFNLSGKRVRTFWRELQE